MKFVRSQHPAAAACCFRVVSDLHREIRLVEAELLLVRLRLAQCRAGVAVAEACEAEVPSGSGLQLPTVCANYPEKNYWLEFDFHRPLLHPSGLRDVEGCNCIEFELFGADETAVVNSFDQETAINSENNVLKDDDESILELLDPKNVTSLLSLANTNGQEQSLDECL